MHDFDNRQASTGYRLAYHPQETNPCPGCGNSHWMIGRATAECAFCGTALPLIAGGNMGNRLARRRPAISHLAA